MEKIPRQEFLNCIAHGMAPQEIAEKYGVNIRSVYQRIERLNRPKEQVDTVAPANPNKKPFKVQRMDTVVRQKDMMWFRVVEVDGDQVKLCSTVKGNTAKHRRKKELTVTLEELNSKYHKKNYSPVTCYIDPALKKSPQEQS